MKTPSATSLPRAPRDESSARFRNYVILMSVRVVCFLLMVLITPYGWYTWVLGIGAVFLPYIAVMIANVGSGPPTAGLETPAHSISSTPTPPPPNVSGSGVEVIRITEANPPKHPATSAETAPAPTDSVPAGCPADENTDNPASPAS